MLQPSGTRLRRRWHSSVRRTWRSGCRWVAGPACGCAAAVVWCQLVRTQQALPAPQLSLSPPQGLLHELDKVQGEARAAAARAEAADAEVQAREQLLAAARVRDVQGGMRGWGWQPGAGRCACMLLLIWHALYPLPAGRCGGCAEGVGAPRRGARRRGGAGAEGGRARAAAGGAAAGRAAAPAPPAPAEPFAGVGRQGAAGARMGLARVWRAAGAGGRLEVQADVAAAAVPAPRASRPSPCPRLRRVQAECSALRAMINCNVCHQRQKDVVITKCWHMFCQQCIKRNLGERGAAVLRAASVAAPKPTAPPLLRTYAPLAAAHAASRARPPACRVAPPQVPWLRRGLWAGRREALFLHVSK